MSKITIEHIALWTNNLEALKDFYVHYFHATSNKKYINSKKGFQSYFLSFASGARLEIMTLIPKVGEKSPDESTTYCGIAHFAFSLGTRSGVDSLIAKLKNDGYEIVSEPRITGDGYYEACILDPDANRIEITE